MNDVVKRSDRLDKALDQADVPAALTALGKLGRRHQLFIRLLAASLLFDLVLSGLLLVIAVRADHTARVASSNKSANYNSCVANNAVRAGQVTLWAHVLDVSESQNRGDPVQQRTVREFRDFVSSLFAPRDCKHPTATPTTVRGP